MTTSPDDVRPTPLTAPIGAVVPSTVPTHWYNLAADLPEPCPPALHPGTQQPLGPDDLAPLFPMALILQEVSTERWIEIPQAVREVYALWRPSPLVRAIDEGVFGVRDLVEVIRRRAADLVNVKLAKCGGLTAARTLLELAAAHGVGTCVGSMMEGPVGIGAAASLVAAHPTTVVSDLDAAWWLTASPVTGSGHRSSRS